MPGQNLILENPNGRARTSIPTFIRKSDSASLRVSELSFVCQILNSVGLKLDRPRCTIGYCYSPGSSKNKCLLLDPRYLIFCTIVSAFVCEKSAEKASIYRKALIFKIAGVHGSLERSVKRVKKTNCLEYRHRYCVRVPAKLSAVSNSWFK